MKKNMLIKAAMILNLSLHGLLLNSDLILEGSNINVLGKPQIKKIIFSLLLVIFELDFFNIYNKKENLALLLNIVVHASLWNKCEISNVK